MTLPVLTDRGGEAGSRARCHDMPAVPLASFALAMSDSRESAVTQGNARVRGHHDVDTTHIVTCAYPHFTKFIVFSHRRLQPGGSGGPGRKLPEVDGSWAPHRSQMTGHIRSEKHVGWANRRLSVLPHAEEISGTRRGYIARR